ncbi:MAG: retropepsin-like aspartic protease family protein [Pseudomonadales bacterium]
MSQPSDNTRTAAKWMFYLTWIIALALGSYFFQLWYDKKHNPNSALSQHSAQVVLEQNSRGHYIAPGSINGVDVTFLLDTGATEVSIPASVAAKLALEVKGSSAVMTANGVIDVQNTLLQRVQLGGLEVRRVPAHINPHMPGDTVLLGMSFLGELAITQRKGTLTLSPP